MSDPLWSPPPERIARSHLTRFQTRVAQQIGRGVATYAGLHRWSVDSVQDFWPHVWEYTGVLGDRGERAAIDLDRMPGATFFPDARLNFAENLLRRTDETPAIVATTERGRDRTVTWADLRVQVRRTAVALRSAGVAPGDRICGIVANIPEAVIAALAASAVGAVWASCSPDFGADGIVDRFGQIAPVVLITIDGYGYGGRQFDCLAKAGDVARRLPSLRQVVIVEMADETRRDRWPANAVSWEEWTTSAAPTSEPFARFPFNHPLYVLFSSGTTGVPKCIVHGAGGTLIEHLKEHQLHCDVHPGDRVFYFTTTGWMMWNWLVTALASDATLVLYDGSPAHPDNHCLFDLADRFDVTLFGTSARFLSAVEKSGLRPRSTHSLASVRTITSTGSPLAPESFDFVYRAIKSDVHLASMSGGTDIVGCFVNGNPNGPVWRGEIQAAGLGMDVQVFDAAGRPVTNETGELICTSPFPSMPIAFWNDPGGSLYRSAYFDRYAGVWCHGDWIRTTDHDGFVIYGRSDTTLNPGGVRIGTAEIYRQVEQIPEVLESVAIGQQWQGDERIVLFVRLIEGRRLDDEVKRRIAERIRVHTSPRHVPARIVQVTDIPRTRSGKIVELAIRRIVAGQDVPNREAIENPASLDQYRNLPELQS